MLAHGVQGAMHFHWGEGGFCWSGAGECWVGLLLGLCEVGRLERGRGGSSGAVQSWMRGRSAGSLWGGGDGWWKGVVGVGWDERSVVAMSVEGLRRRGGEEGQGKGSEG